MTFQEFKNVMELIYYISFILLTIGLAYYAAKTYHFQADKHSEVFLKIHIPEIEMTQSQYVVMLEIFNHANILIKDIQIKAEDKEFTKIDFLKPNESSYVPIGFAFTTFDGVEAHILDKQFTEPTTLKISCVYQNRESEFDVKTDIVFNKCVFRGDSMGEISRSLDKVVSVLNYALLPDGLRRINGSVPESLSKIANSIEKLKTHE